MGDPIRVLVVDDSRTFREALTVTLESNPRVQVVGSVWNGRKALEFLAERSVDLVTLDVEMPEMDGLSTLKAIGEYNRSRPEQVPVGVLLVSAHTSHGAAVTVEGLQAGAFDFITKPVSGTPEENLDRLRKELAPKLLLFSARRAALRCRKLEPCCPEPVPVRSERRPPAAPIRLIAIAASTGGPAALATLLPALRQRTDLPIVVVQHIPPGFTEYLASSLRCGGKLQTEEARENDPIRNGRIYIAPGGRHLVLRKTPSYEVVASLNDQDPVQGCRPSADVLFRSAALAYGGGVAAVVLTGMGSDGTAGLLPIRRAGGFVVAQDEATSVVWGMPGSAVASGRVDVVAPLSEIPKVLLEAVVESQGHQKLSGRTA